MRPIVGYFHEYSISIWNSVSKILLGKVSHLVPRYLERRKEKGEADISSSVDSPVRSLVFFLLNGFVAPIINILQPRMPRTAPLWPKRSPSSVTSATIINSNLCRTLFFILTSSVPYSLSLPSSSFSPFSSGYLRFKSSTLFSPPHPIHLFRARKNFMVTIIHEQESEFRTLILITRQKMLV